MSGALLLDAVLVLTLVAYAVTGARHGLVHGLLSLGGFVVGGLVGIRLLPVVVENVWDGEPGSVLAPGTGRVVVVVIGVLVLAWAGQLLGSLLGRAVRDRLTWAPAQVVDRALGAVAAVVAVALLSWFVAGALRASPAPSLSRAVAESRVVQALDRVVPPGTGGLAGDLRALLESSGFPRVFDRIGPEIILPVDPPDPTAAAGPAGVAAGGVVKVTGIADSCARGQEGTGFVVADERVVTNAHVVAGVEEPAVQVTGEGRRWPARVVVMDADRDLAVLAVDGLPTAPLPLGEDLERGDAAVVAGFPLDGPYTAEAARVRQVLTARGEDIYGNPGVERRVYSLHARVEPGNSGGPLLDAAGRVVGVVFAKSLDDPSTGYALTLAESAPVLSAAATAEQPVDVGACTVG
ncbi:MarP family serine protease [Thalassiella azotivora]